jgi:hypothetical protein
MIFPNGELALLEGHRALRAEYGRKLTVISDENNSANTPDETTVGTSFVAVVSPASENDLNTDLGTDIRFDAWAEVEKAWDPEVQETARLTDGVTNWRVTKCDRNAAVAVNRYYLIEIEPQDLGISGGTLDGNGAAGVPSLQIDGGGA